ncbi:MAG TPA: calcium-translocating P-type ATPase, SERCA-type [Bacillota bacterium]|nr:calcium-translocating P-type ATPase, SERCA-type [Bacillota bacterium]
MLGIDWYKLGGQETVDRLKTSISEGLNDKEVEERLEQYGRNELETQARKSILSRFIEQLSDFMIIILILAAIVSGLLGAWTDAIIILFIVVLNAVLGLVQESRAENSLAALKELTSPKAKVKRNRTINIVPASELVPGDIVVLDTGDYVPADLRLIQASSLKIQESALTGESLPVDKAVELAEDADLTLGDRLNMAYTSSLVTYGRGSGIVVKTGMATEIGKIARMIQTQEEIETPLQKRLELLGKTLGIGALGICGVIFTVGTLYGKDVFQMFMTAVSLAVAAIPEGLPAIVTIVLAIGVQRMAGRKAIIRKLPSVETLGSATVICSDKTGTLTQNKMTAERIYANGGFLEIKDLTEEKQQESDIDLLVTIGTLCNDTKIKWEEDGPELVGDPTETALVDLGLRLGLDRDSKEEDLPRLDEIPFDSERKLMTTIHSYHDGKMAFTKGAPDELLDRCTDILIGGHVRQLTPELGESILSANEEMGANALRVLGMAYRDIAGDIHPSQVESTIESNLIFVGLVGMIDPPREEAKEAIKLCKRAGIKTVMITGDHKVTASAIAKQLGILEDNGLVMTGVELDRLSDGELIDKIKSYSVYARVSPEHKVRIVKAWQAHDDIVAMTGDGVNDAPALKRANIGAAMGITGTDVAKEASDMVLTDDNFATIVSAVEEGRVIFANILKAIQFLLSCNVGEILVLFIATMLNWHEPLLPIHILWVNLVTDSLPALALGMDPPEEGIMDRKPRAPGSSIFDRGMVGRILYQGATVSVITLAAFLIGSTASLGAGRTMAFAVLALSQLFHAFNVRSNRYSILKIGILSNRKLIGAVLVSVALQLAVMLIPLLSGLFHVTALSLRQWGIVLLLSFVPIVVVELAKLLTLNRAREE